MPKTYEKYTCYPEHDHKIYRDTYDGKIDNVISYINAGVNIYQKTKFSLVTPLFLAISGKHTEIIDLYLDVYQRDLQFIESSHVIDNFCHKMPVLIAYGVEEIKLVEKIYEDYRKNRETYVPEKNFNGVVVLLKENNFTPKRVVHLAPQSELENTLVLKIIQIVLHNGQLDLNGCNNLSDSLVKVTTINGLFSVFEKLVNLGCDYDEVKLFRLAMKSGQIPFLNEIMLKFNININTIVDTEIDLFNLIGSAEWEMCEWIITRLIVENEFLEHDRLFWKNMLDMCSDRYNGGTLYHYAIICNQVEFGEKYLSYGPNLKLRNRDGSIPIHHAFHSARYKKLVVDMIALDNDLLQITNGEHKNVLHLMVERNWCDVFENITRIYPGSITLFFKDTEIANTVINQATFQNYTEIVTFLIGRHIDKISHENVYKILYTAVAANAYDIVEYILTQAKFDLCQSSQNPLIYALWNRNMDIYLALRQNLGPQSNLLDIKDVGNNSLLRYTIWSREYFNNVQDYEQFNSLFNELLLAGHAWQNIESYSRQNLLHCCASMGNDTILQQLLSLNLDIELCDAEGNLPIHYAPNLETFKMLNEKTNGRLINMKNKITGNTPLHMLVMKSFQNDLPTDLLEYMIENGADVNSVNNINRTPLHLVRNDAWCRLLLQHGGNFNAIDDEGNTPAHKAFMNSNYKVAMMLFEQDIDLKVTNRSGFNYLAGLMQQNSTIQHQLFPNVMRTDNVKLVNLVSIHCNSYNEVGTPMLIESMYSNNLLCQMIMNDPNCDVNIHDKVSNRRPIHATAIYNKFELISGLLAMGANINDRDSDGNTPLHHTCQFYHEHAVDYLKYGANVNAENNNKETPLHYVALSDLHGHAVC